MLYILTDVWNIICMKRVNHWVIYVNNVNNLNNVNNVSNKSCVTLYYVIYLYHYSVISKEGISKVEECYSVCDVEWMSTP